MDAVSSDLGSRRLDYRRGELRRADLDPDPIVQLRRWLDDALADLPPPADAGAAVLATCGADGTPSARVVLVRGCDPEGLAFYTNYDSRKAREMAASGRAALCFFWAPLQRQARVAGAVAKVDRATSEAYFASRPRESQLGAWASPQSEILAGREELDARLAEVTARFGDGPVPCPPGWGGYRLRPDEIELWQGRASRLHDRFRYRREGEAWVLERLAP